jgi:hypothetical protein
MPLLLYFIFMIEEYVVKDGPDKGRIPDIDIAMDLAYTEDAWREEKSGLPMNQPPERLGKPEVRYRELVEGELSRLILEDITSKAKREFDEIYSTEAARQADPEENNEEWLRYRMVNRLSSLGETHGFDDETCYEILAMPFPEGLETAYSYLTRAGLNADTILADFIES